MASAALYSCSFRPMTLSIIPVCLKYWIMKSCISEVLTFLPTIMPLISCLGRVRNFGAISSGLTLYFFMTFMLKRSSPCSGHLSSTWKFAISFLPLSLIIYRLPSINRCRQHDLAYHSNVMLDDVFWSETAETLFHNAYILQKR